MDLTSPKWKLNLVKGAVLEEEKLILSAGMYNNDLYKAKIMPEKSNEFSIPLEIQP